MTEAWKSVDGFKGIYEVSNFGRVRSLDRIIVRRNTGVQEKHRGRVLAIARSKKSGYCSVALSVDSAPRTYRVHVLVASAFVSNPLNLPEVDHRDRNTSNNLSNNLRWATRSMQRYNTAQTPDGLNPYRGVQFEPRYSRKWSARLSRKLLGRFETREEAATARAIAYEAIFPSYEKRRIRPRS